jgi:hypothetical protein
VAARSLAPDGDTGSALGGFVLGHGAAYITNYSILSDTGQVVKVASY